LCAQAQCGVGRQSCGWSGCHARASSVLSLRTAGGLLPSSNCQLPASRVLPFCTASSACCLPAHYWPDVLPAGYCPSVLPAVPAASQHSTGLMYCQQSTVLVYCQQRQQLPASRCLHTRTASKLPASCTPSKYQRQEPPAKYQPPVLRASTGIRRRQQSTSRQQQYEPQALPAPARHLMTCLSCTVPLLEGPQAAHSTHAPPYRVLPYKLTFGFFVTMPTAALPVPSLAAAPLHPKCGCHGQH
jgi:hypothetical protein